MFVAAAYYTKIIKYQSKFPNTISTVDIYIYRKIIF